MFREIDHTADVAYEVIARNLEELLQDVLSILLENSEVTYLESDLNGLLNQQMNKLESLQNSIKKCYNIDKSDSEKFIDSFFDAVNDMISKIDRGYFPIFVEGTCVYFSQRRITLRIKALTYHGLHVKLGDEISLRMVFDI